MADNNYKETNSEGDNRLPSNPYASTGGLIPYVQKKDYCNYLASVGFSVAAGGATTTITPLTGNTNADLLYYRVEIIDESGNAASNSLDLNNRTTPFVVDTSGLVGKDKWTLSFYGAEQSVSGDVPCSLEYSYDLGVIAAAGGSGDTIPAIWNNVTMNLLLRSTDDVNYTGFPDEGIVIKDGDVINLNDYSEVADLVNLGSYLFDLQLKKIGTEPVASTPTPASGDVYTAFNSTVSFPYAISKSYVTVIDSIAIKTDVAGTHTQLVTITLANEGVKPSVSFTLSITVAA